MSLSVTIVENQNEIKKNDDLIIKLYSPDAVEMGSNEERQVLLGNQQQNREELIVGTKNEKRNHEIADLIFHLFNQHQATSLHQHPKSNPTLPPVKRGTRHRNYYVWQMNEFVRGHLVEHAKKNSCLH